MAQKLQPKAVVRILAEQSDAQAGKPGTVNVGGVV